MKSSQSSKSSGSFLSLASKAEILQPYLSSNDPILSFKGDISEISYRSPNVIMSSMDTHVLESSSIKGVISPYSLNFMPLSRCSPIGQGFQAAYNCLFNVLFGLLYIISLRVAPRKRRAAHYVATLFCLL